MKQTKMSLANVQGKLSRNEMKNIMAGDAPGGGTCAAPCNMSCFVQCGGQSTPGECGVNQVSGKCGCSAVC